MANTIDEVRTRRSTNRRNYTLLQKETLQQFFSSNRQQMTQVFWIDPLQESILRGKNGASFRIPALAFEDQWGDPVLGMIKVEIIELNQKSDILLADRATTSGNQLLETGGAFYLGASQNNNPLRLGIPVQANIPISSRVDYPDAMSIFGGRNQADRFNWVPDQGAKADLRINTIDQTFDVSIRQPGWINCDHYYRLRRQQHYFLKIDQNTELAEQEVFLIYRTINTVAKLQLNEKGHFDFPSPIPLPSIIYSLGAAEGTFYQGFHQFIQDPYRQESQQEFQVKDIKLSMSPILQEDIKANLEEQIRFWDREVTQEITTQFRQRLNQRTRRWKMK